MGDEVMGVAVALVVPPVPLMAAWKALRMRAQREVHRCWSRC